MAGFGIYLPGQSGPNPTQLAKFGIDDLAGDFGEQGKSAEFASIISGGPDGGVGNLVTWRTGKPENDFPFTIAAEQDWQKAPGAEYWIGIDPSRPVKPSDIRRPHGQRGLLTRLADGNEWNIPCAAKLPASHGLDEGGQYVRKPAQQFRQYWEQSFKFAVDLTRSAEMLLRETEGIPEDCKDVEQLEGDFKDVPLENSWEFVALALSINYRLNEALISRLGLITDESLLAAIRSAIELDPILTTLQKKTDHLRAESSSPAG